MSDMVRPDPDALIAQLRARDERARRGRLRIYFGANASGAKNILLDKSAPPDSDPAHFQAFFTTLFNTVVPSNAGKWCYCEESPGVITMAYPDAILAYAKEHTLFARMHNLI